MLDRSVAHKLQSIYASLNSYGRISGYLVSAREYEELRRLREFERRVYRLKGLPKEIVEAIKAAKMDSSHDHLNALLEDNRHHHVSEHGGAC